MLRLLMPWMFALGTCLVGPALAAQGRGVSVQPAPRADAPTSEQRVALVIGNGAYSDAPLRNPVNDAKAMKAALELCKFEVALLENAGKREMEDAIRAFGDRIRGGAVGLFYFAGHGVQVKGVNYLVPVGANMAREDEVPYQAVEAGQVLDKMDAAKNKLNILILDACRNNPFARSWRSGGDKGLAQVKAPTGTLICYATAPGSVAADGSGQNGLYTEALLAQMKEPGQELEKVFKKVREKVLAGSGGAQTPWESNSTVGDFYFRPLVAPKGGPTEAELEATYWEAIRDVHDEKEFESFLKRFPTGTHSELAQLKLKSLRKTSPMRGNFGMSLLELDQGFKEALGAKVGVVVGNLEKGLPANKAGVMRLDVIIAIDRVPVHTPNEVYTRLNDHRVGESVELAILRDGKTIRLFLVCENTPNALGSSVVVSNQAEPWKALQRDKLETKEEYAQRVAALGAVKVGTATVTVDNYDVDTKRLVLPLKADDWAKAYVRQGRVVLELDRAQVKQLVAAGGSATLAARFEVKEGRPQPGGLTLSTAIGAFQVGEEPPPVPGAVKNAQGLWEANFQVGGASFVMVLVPAGSSRMGSERGTEAWMKLRETPVHEVTVSQDYWLGKYEVTQGQWQALMGNNPANFKNAGLDAPVEQVSWDDCQQFLLRLNGKGSGTYRLPTEAEWEYACRAGSQDETYGPLDAVAWYDGNSGNATHPVGQKQPNAFGLYDMIGNVWEWCQDWYRVGYYIVSPPVDPQGASSGSDRVFRGGSWFDHAGHCRSACRGDLTPASSRYNLGLRLLRTLP